ncbi:MAG: 3D domain-containing protein [bacterium]|nr:3D domain-containing protein [bacterium]
MFKYVYFVLVLFISLVIFPFEPLNNSLSPILAKCFNSVPNSLYNEDTLAYRISNIKTKHTLKKYYDKKYYVTATAYTPSIFECDSSPFITASGRKVRDGMIAVSRDLYKILPFGSKVRIKNKIYIVEDLMNKRWKKRIDFFMWSKESARTFGKRSVVIEVL